MKSSKVGLRYAKAALQQAIEDNNVKAVFEDMQGVHATVAESKELRLALQSPVIKSSDKEAVLLELFKGTQKTTQNLIKVMAANERTQYLGDVAAGFIGLYNDTQGVKVVKVTTAVALDGALKEQVLAKAKTLTGSDNVSLENEIDPEIIGGFVLRVGDMQYNASISNQLSTLRKEFSNSISKLTTEWHLYIERSNTHSWYFTINSGHHNFPNIIR